jgi:hypothetical protein
MQCHPPLHPDPSENPGSWLAGARSPSHQRLMQHVTRLDLPYGHEESFKMAGPRLLLDRVLIGFNTDVLAASDFYEIAFDLGMPLPCKALLETHFAQANAVLFGIEGRGDNSVCKVYLEFWDQVRRQMRQTGPSSPRLLHLGLKWDTGHPDQHQVARYLCHPMLSAREVLRGIANVYPAIDLPSAREDALSIVRQGLKRNPSASMLFMEVCEAGNPRRSFDINLYKTGLRVGDVESELKSAAAHLGVPVAELLPALRHLGNLPLGHLAGGIDRHGNEFLSLYAELRSI